MSNSNIFPENRERREKILAIEIAKKCAKIISNDEQKVGILLCEGLESSIDVALYSIVYRKFVVVPSNGCTDVMRMLPRIRKYSEYPVYGIIDRDSRSKATVKSLAKQGVYTTKLPFIENIICCPEVLKVICRSKELDYQSIIRTIRTDLTNVLAERLRYLNPFNVDIPIEQEISCVKITIISKENAVNKTIDLDNVMYTFRDKTIVSRVADAIGIRSKEAYYQFIIVSLNGKLRNKLVSIMSRYLPEIKIEQK